MNLNQNKEFDKDVHDLTLLTTQVAEKWECTREHVSALRKELGLPKGKYRSIAPALTEQFESDVQTEGLSIKALKQKWNVGTYTVLTARKKLGLSKKRPHSRSSLHNPEYLADLVNPCLNNAQVADKWNKSHSTVYANRKKLGYGSWQSGPTGLELKMANILNSLGIAYREQYEIGKFRTDFYLGFNFHIDVNGEWVHSQPEAIERDKRKADYLVSEGHVIYVVPESRLDDAKLKTEIYEHFTSQVRKYLGFPWE